MHNWFGPLRTLAIYEFTNETKVEKKLKDKSYFSSQRVYIFPTYEKLAY